MIGRVCMEVNAKKDGIDTSVAVNTQVFQGLPAEMVTYSFSRLYYLNHTNFFNFHSFHILIMFNVYLFQPPQPLNFLETTL